MTRHYYSRMKTSHLFSTISGCLIALTALFLAEACDIDVKSLPLNRSDVIGQYQSNFLSGAVELIELRGDSTYFHSYRSTDSTLHSQSGRWQFIQHKTDGPRIRLKAFVTWYPVDVDCYVSGPRAKLDTLPRNWFPYVKKLDNGTIRIERCPNRRQYYILERNSGAG